jgi:hypothetical protein
MKNNKIKMQENKQMIESKDVGLKSNDFVVKDSTNLNQASRNKQSKINNQKTPAKDKGVERDATLGANTFSTATKIVEYCKKYKLTPLSESNNPLSKKFLRDCKKLLLIAKNKKSDLYAMKKDLEIITTTFPDILYGSNSKEKDLKNKYESTGIPEKNIGLLALNIKIVYERVLKSKAFKDFSKSYQEEDKEEMKKNYEITISKQKEKNIILKKQLECDKENYEKMKLKLDTLIKQFDTKKDELTIKEQDIEYIKQELSLVKTNKDELERQLAVFESTKNTEVETTVNKDLIAKIKPGFDNKSEEGKLSLSKTSDKKIEKHKHEDDEVNYSFSPEADKKNLEGISTNNYTDSVNLLLDDNDHVSCNGEEYIVYINND